MKKVDLAWHSLRRCSDYIARQSLQWMPQRKRTTKEHPEERSGEGDVESWLQVQPEEDRGDITEQSWIEMSCLRPVPPGENAYLKLICGNIVYIIAHLLYLLCVGGSNVTVTSVHTAGLITSLAGSGK